MTEQSQAGPLAHAATERLRVLLIGLPGVGKSTLAEALKDRFVLPHFAIDAYRVEYADGTVAGDYFARAHFLRACGTQSRGVFEFSAVGAHRFATANAFREQPGALLTVWVDAPHGLREERLAKRGGRVPWPRYRVDETREAMEEKAYEVLRMDLASGFWAQEPGWQAHRLDTDRSLGDATTELLRLVQEFSLMAPR